MKQLNILLILSSVVVSANGQPLTWEDCVRLTATHNPSLAAASANVDAASSAISIERSALFPQLSAGASAIQSGANGNDSTTYSSSLNVEQLLYSGGRKKAAIRSAVAGLDSETALQSSSRSDVTYALRSAFVDVLHAKEQVVLLAQIEARRADNLELVELRYEGGREHKGSVASSQASLFDAQVKGKQAARAVAVNRMILAREMGLTSLPAEVAVEGSLVQGAPSDETDLETIAKDVPAYLESQAALERSEAQLSEAESGLRPELSLVGSVGRYGENDLDDDQWSAGIKLSIPIWSGGQTRLEVSKAQASLRAADAELADVLNERVQMLAEMQQAFSDAADNVEVQTKYEEAAEIRAEISRQQYEGGLLSFENWVVIEDDLIAKEEKLLDARKSALIAEAAWWRTIGYEVFSQTNLSTGDE